MRFRGAPGAPGNFFAPPGVDYCEKPRVSHPPTVDAELVAAARAGDRSAFDQLAVRYQDRLFHAMTRIVGSSEDAADAVQDAFVQAYLKLGSFRGDAQFYTWLYRIAMNMAIGRRRRRRPTLSVDAAREDAGVEPLDDHAGPVACALSAEEAATVQQALARLGDQQRKILVLREIDGASYEELAEILELPVGTVRSRLFRARIQLRDQLKSMEEERGQRSEVGGPT